VAAFAIAQPQAPNLTEIAILTTDSASHDGKDPYGLAAGDVNGDGFEDILVSNIGTDFQADQYESISIFKNLAP
jgi:hypothetical protein